MRDYRTVVESSKNQSVPIIRHRAGEPGRADVDEVAVEEPLEIRVRGRSLAVTMRTPGHDEDLSVGFLLSEGIVAGPSDVLRVEPCGRSEAGNVVNVVLAPEVYVDFERLTRHVFASSSCGVCGKASIDAVRTIAPPLPGDEVRIGAALLAELPTRMRAAQAAFSRTGGLHAAALFDLAGELLVIREDVGRHNAVDKVLGHARRDPRGPGYPLARHVLLVSGRASFEIVQKALCARIPVLAAVSAPSSLAVQLAQESGQTLVGFLRDARMNVYCGAERIVSGAF